MGVEDFPGATLLPQRMEELLIETLEEAQQSCINPEIREGNLMETESDGQREVSLRLQKSWFAFHRKSFPLNTSNLVILPSSYAAKSSKPMPYTTKAHGPIPKVNIKEILLSCKPAGPELIKIYRTQKFFTKSERARLISTIVSYYLDNEIHLNLQTSYALEKEILKMFPTETLDMYRQAKRGKIYMRFGSAKWIYSKHKRLADEAVKKMQDREEKQNSDNNPDISSEEGEQTSTVITENAGFDLKKYKLRSVTNNENAEIKNDDKRIHVIQDVLLQNIQNDIKH
ncbi:uncharacterized protein ACN427_001336 [Glossina fuscipes fuscipes]